MFKHLLVPIDGSGFSEEVATDAVLLAKETGAQITFFYAQPEFKTQFYGEGALIILFDPTFPERYSKAMAAEADHILQRAKDSAAAAGVKVDTDSVIGELPYKAIIEAAERHGCDLIFMASHGRRGVAGLLLGSETQKVLVHSKIPVLVNR